MGLDIAIAVLLICLVHASRLGPFSYNGEGESTNSTGNSSHNSTTVNYTNSTTMNTNDSVQVSRWIDYCLVFYFLCLVPQMQTIMWSTTARVGSIYTRLSAITALIIVLVASQEFFDAVHFMCASLLATYCTFCLMRLRAGNTDFSRFTVLAKNSCSLYSTLLKIRIPMWVGYVCVAFAAYVSLGSLWDVSHSLVSDLWPEHGAQLHALVVFLGACQTVLLPYWHVCSARDPSTWPYIVEMREACPPQENCGACKRCVKNQVMQDCDAYSDLYSLFRVEVEDVFLIRNDPLVAAFWETEQRVPEPETGPKVKTLYHGTSGIGAKRIVTTGFRLPVLAGMFGKGIYFADTPMKSWQYSDNLGYMLMCDVVLGRQRKIYQANKYLALDALRRPLSFGGSFEYHSACGITREQGGALRAPEYIVYDSDQVLPTFLLKLRQL